MSADPAFAAVVGSEMAQIATANTNRDGTGTVGTVLTAGASGTRVERVRVVATGTTTAGAVRLFLYDGTNYRLYKEILVQAVTPSTTIAVWEAELATTDLLLPSGWSLRASTHNAETFNVFAFAGDF